MSNLQLGQYNLIRSPKLKIGYYDLLKVQLDPSEVQGCMLHTLLPRDVHCLCFSKID